MNDAGSSNSPGPVRPFDVTDEQLSAELKKWTGTTPALHPVGELLDRHWEAAFAYARLCTDGPRAAGMLTTAAFTRLFGESLRQAGPTSAWRPHLLVTVRRIAAEWDSDGRQELLHPALLTGTGPGDRAAARLLPPANRRLLSRAFQRLPQSSRAVLWHTEVEAEPLAVPAALLGLDEEGARAELRRARARLREESLQVHRELATEDECLRYIRMLDVTFRRGAMTVDPDLQQHLNRCTHCRNTADQLDRFNGFLGLTLAEAVLGWGAQAYVESRAGLTGEPAEPEPPRPPAAAPAGGEPFTSAAGEAFAATAPGTADGDTYVPTGHESSAAAAPGRPASAPRTGARRSASGPRAAARPSAPADGARSHRSAYRAARRARRRNLAAAVVTVSGLVVLPLVLWSVLSSGDGPAPAPGGKPSKTPGSGPSTPGPSWAGASETSQGTLSGRLHNVGSGLCVAVVGKKTVEGAETELAKCSSAASQRWTYETDGLLRNAAAPDLCLDSHLGYSVRLASCDGTSRPNAKDIRYDFTLQGALVPRWDQDLALAPAATDGGGALVVKTRANTADQRWVIDASKPDLQMEVVNWGADSPPSAPAATPKSATPSPTPSATAPTPQPTPSASGSVDVCPTYPYYCSWGGQDAGRHDGGYGPGTGRRR
ncbi:RICIN domain-containing protein [Streptomyces herbicida]|uniref:RICIN domain-containing protein n=1 Tax=Streptomyces herbicida TaxID=3065675 RepID=UPI00292D8808|nr:ricin-type beta-trefoil lectin domain protein [Streptomyces sp. NEAU-HV9]